jgi:5-methyltetrahydropteroyltriglutamate--homocysteine methyltransferase
MVGAVPDRYGHKGGNVDLQTYFTMGRGSAELTPMEMSKWCDSNYHYLVPELGKGQQFKLNSRKPIEEFKEAKDLGIKTRPVLVSPASFLTFGKGKDDLDSPADRLSLLDNLLPVYKEVLKELKNEGAEWVQFDEPQLVYDMDDATKEGLKKAYRELASVGPKIMCTTFFERVSDIDTAVNLESHGLHVDVVEGDDQLDDVLAKIPQGKVLSVGIVHGRNVWKTNLSGALDTLEKAAKTVGKENLVVAPSCSLNHTAVDLEMEDEMDPTIKSWLAFAKQKLGELSALAKGLSKGRDAVKNELAESDKVVESRRTSKMIHDDQVKQRVANRTSDIAKRKSAFKERQKKQREILKLPTYPTTTIGSFPQTQEVRQQRGKFRRGEISEQEYNDFLKNEIEKSVRWQESIGMDVLVHGEFERTDMVEHFGQLLKGFTFTKYGWVQSYGSRGVKPPIIYGDVSRPQPMTVDWIKYSQSLTNKHMKGMLTGPVTICGWSFVRDDQDEEDTCRQVAFAIRDEVCDLEKAGIKVIQIDEAAFREGLPLQRKDWDHYLKWAVECFGITSCGVDDSTQIHTHMCYSEFNDIIKSIAAMDADVISIETSRSQMELLEAFVDFKYPNEIGPGVYDIHSPRVPSKEEMVDLLKKAQNRVDNDLIWVNPDCGLKTRDWKQVEPACENMCAAAKQIRC